MHSFPDLLCFCCRSFADGTNAWTDTDHTAYTIGCAGGEGFLRILPVYIDHILVSLVLCTLCSARR